MVYKFCRSCVFHNTLWCVGNTPKVFEGTLRGLGAVWDLPGVTIELGTSRLAHILLRGGGHLGDPNV